MEEALQLKEVGFAKVLKDFALLREAKDAEAAKYEEARVAVKKQSERDLFFQREETKRYKTSSEELKLAKDKIYNDYLMAKASAEAVDPEKIALKKLN